ncbi:multifunctional methyltransferase subunit TRM112-like protein [Perognathus longimembris pacificus]|uniref:multifunctional methyltransferase subunit TRM112-like protein n=1 Tax=Perognathus longimembris pacificus TaxID=214514 RepID=UPI002019B51C|nr:multifunctional methyltransferase subunit TRM112-like protein [Perognathus longimembris pacificus]
MTPPPVVPREPAGGLPVPAWQAGRAARNSTHNLLTAHARGVGPRGFPLRLRATEVRVSPVESKVAGTLQLDEGPTEPVGGYERPEAFLRKMHHVFLEVDVLEGTLPCPESGRLFPISRGIPDMLLNDEEAETSLCQPAL